MKKKKKKSENEKKRGVVELEWATAHFGAGSRYNRLYHDRAWETGLGAHGQA